MRSKVYTNDFKLYPLVSPCDLEAAMATASHILRIAAGISEREKKGRPLGALYKGINRTQEFRVHREKMENYQPPGIDSHFPRGQRMVQNRTGPLWHMIWHLFIRLNTISPYDLTIMFPGIYPKKLKFYIHTKPAHRYLRQHDSQLSKTPFHRWMDKWTILH